MIHARVPQTVYCLGLWALLGCSTNDSAPPAPYDFPSNAGGRAQGPNRAGSGGQASAGVGNTSGGVGNVGGGMPGAGGLSGGGVPPVAQGGGAGGETEGGAAGVEAPPKCTPSANCVAYCTAKKASVTCAGSSDRCACDCEEKIAKSCSPALTTLLSCAGVAPQVQCSPYELFTGCQQQTFDLAVCRADALGLGCAKNLPACRTYCEAALVASCPSSPENLPDCLCNCENTLVAKCANEFTAFMQCGGTPLTLGCAQSGLPAPATCTAEWDLFTACLVK